MTMLLCINYSKLKGHCENVNLLQKNLVKVEILDILTENELQKLRKVLKMVHPSRKSFFFFFFFLMILMSDGDTPERCIP